MEWTTSPPQTFPWTTIGLATEERIPSLSRMATRRALGPSSASIRAGRPVLRTLVASGLSSSRNRNPTSVGSSAAAQLASTVSVSSFSERTIVTASAPSSMPASSVAARKSSSGGTLCATSVATRRSAACSSVSRAARRTSRRERVASSLTTSDDTRNAASTDHRCDVPGSRLHRGGKKKYVNAAMLATDTAPATARPYMSAVGTTAKRRARPIPGPGRAAPAARSPR